MINFKFLKKVKKNIKLKCDLYFHDQKNKITKEKIEQIVAEDIELFFSTETNRRQIYEETRDDMFDNFFTKNGDISGVSDQKDHVAWFKRSRIENKPYWEVYRQYLVEEGKVPIQSINDLDKYTDTILSDMEDPNREGSWDRRGLVVGSVQSGKTANYLGLIAKARDAGYKFIVILSGANNDLRQQTQQRIDDNYIGLSSDNQSFDGKDNLSKTKLYNRLGEIRLEEFPNQYQPPSFGTIDDINGDFNKTRAQGINKYEIQANDKISYIFVCKKHATPLKNLIDLTASLPQSNFKLPNITKFPLLLIDDECDHYSIDTKKTPRDNNGNFEPDSDPTKINGLIRKLLQCFSRRIYVGYTATPFANILVHEDKIHNEFGEDIFPKSFIYDIKPSPNHQGLESIFGKEVEDDGVRSREISNFLIPINDFCKDPNDLFCKEGWFPPKHDRHHVPIYNDKEDPIDNNLDESSLSFYLKLIEITKNKYNKNINIAPSLIHAIMSFILACAVRNIRSVQQFHSHKSMLIHVTKFVSPQEILTNDIRILFNSILECLKDESEYKKYFHDSLKSIYENYFLKKTIEYVDPKKETITYEKILFNENGLKFCIGEISRNIVTMSGKTSKPDFDRYRDEKGFGLMAIIVGGDKLSRGVTFEGLSTTYFLRSSRMFDTLMQMGRWFGYRKGYADLCRLYTSSELLEAFEKISVASQEVRLEIRRMNKQNKTPKDFGLWIAASPYCHYIPTARNKMRHAEKSFVNYSMWGSQMPTMLWEKEQVLKNYDLTSEFIKGLGEPTEKNISRDYGINKIKDRKTGKIHEKQIEINSKNSFYWKNIDHKSVTNFLKKFKAHDASGFQPQEMTEYIKTAVEKKGMLTNWNVALMGDGSSGIKPKIGGHEVNLAFRKPRNTFTSDKASYGVIWNPLHEAIDIDPKKFREANNEHFKDEENQNEIEFTKLLRKKRHSKNGLIIIYPILPVNYHSVPLLKNTEETNPQGIFDESWNDLKKQFKNKYTGKIKQEVEERKALISIAISFPETSEDLATHIIVNSTYVRLSKQEDDEEDY